MAKMNPYILSTSVLALFLLVGGIVGESSSSSSSSSAISKENSHEQHQPPEGEERLRPLKLVHVVMRHSIRAPVTLYPKDPHIDNAFDPFGRGELTRNGISYAYEIGKNLRARYGSYLGTLYNRTEFYAESTGVTRAQATILTVNAGLWNPPHPDQRFDKHLDWIPVPVFITKMEEDMLLLVAKDCPQYNIERRRIEESPTIQSKLSQYEEMMKLIEEKSGQTMKTFDDIGDIYATLLAEKTFGLTLPSWTDDIFGRMEEASAYSFVIKAYNKKMQRFKGGLLLKKIIGDWKAAIAGTSPIKMYLYGGHDSTIANLLSALQVFIPQVPNYGMTIMLELSYDESLKTYGLEIFTKNSTADPLRLTLPGCTAFCPLDDVLRLTNDVIPVNWEAECATDDPDYTTPPFEGP